MVSIMLIGIECQNEGDQNMKKFVVRRPSFMKKLMNSEKPTTARRYKITVAASMAV